jgi:Putative heavy-metal-binding
VSWFDNLLAGLFGTAGAGPPVSAADMQRQAEWARFLQRRPPSFVEPAKSLDASANDALWWRRPPSFVEAAKLLDPSATDALQQQRLPSFVDAGKLLDESANGALQQQRLPSFVEARLRAAASGRTPWVATMSPAELGLARARGVRPLAMVSGTCWFHYGWSWTEGHGQGWREALTRLKAEAAAAGANAVVDVKMRKIQLAISDSMDFTLVGTAVRIDALPAGQDPAVATVPALEFVRLVEADIVPVGIAIGARYDYLNPSFYASFNKRSVTSIDGTTRPFTSMPLPELGRFWEGIRRSALADLHQDAQRQGNGVLAHTHLGQLIKVEQAEDSPPRFLGRHIVIGTVVDASRAPGGIPHEIRTVVDMRDGLSPLTNPPVFGHNACPVREQGGDAGGKSDHSSAGFEPGGAGNDQDDQDYSSDQNFSGGDDFSGSDSPC